MSFRARLRLFFVLIVIVPMLSVAIVLFRLISDNETGKADASIAARQRAAMNLYREATRRADGAVEGVGKDRVMANALLTGNIDRAKRRGRGPPRAPGGEGRSPGRGAKGVLFNRDKEAVAPAPRGPAGPCRGGGGGGR